jgi:hypothetical protein
MRAHYLATELTDTEIVVMNDDTKLQQPEVR